MRFDYETCGFDRLTNKRLFCIPIGIYNRKNKNVLWSGRTTIKLNEYMQELNKYKK